MGMNNANTRVFVEGTQRGYAVGTRDSRGTIREEHFSDVQNGGIEGAYKAASKRALDIRVMIEAPISRTWGNLAKKAGWVR